MSCSAKRDPNGTWHIQYRWTDWTGTKKKSQKRGFKTKKEAEEWYAHFILQQTSDPTMTLNDFWEIYKADMEKRLRKTTMKQKEYVMKDKVLPYFGNTPNTMKKGDDFFRVTFNRSSEEIQRFERNISEYTKQSGLSRPVLIAVVCNYFVENGMELSVVGGRMTVKGIIPQSSNVADNSLPVVAYTEPEAEPVNVPSISASDSDEMLRVMGLI